MSTVKRHRLAAVAHAALDGDLAPDWLRDTPTDQALDHPQGIDGIGPFGAERVLARGANTLDMLPTRERRLIQAVGHLYDTHEPDADLAGLAEPWRPYRTWCCVLIRSWWDSQLAAHVAELRR